MYLFSTDTTVIGLTACQQCDIAVHVNNNVILFLIQDWFNTQMWNL